MANQVYKYAIDTDIIFSKTSKYSDKSFRIDNRNIVGFSVTHDYINNLYPISFIQFSLSEKDYYFIVDNKNDVRVKLSLHAYLVDDTSTLEDYLSNKIPHSKNTTIDCIFRPFFDDVSPYSESKLYEEDPLKEETSEFKVISMYLFSEESLEKNKTDINFVLNDVNVFDALIYICNKSSISNLIIKEPDNTKKYEQIICPPLKLKESVSFIQEHYGIYNQGSNLYQDFNRTYIIPKYFKEAIVEKKEIDRIFFLLNNISGENSNMDITSSYNSKYDAYMINTYNNVQILDNSNFNKEIVGDKLNIINANNINDDTEILDLSLNSYTSENDIIKNKNIVYYNDNKYSIKEYYYDIVNSQITISMTLMNIDLSYISPNKEFVLMFEDSETNKKYGGNYSLKTFTYSVKRDLGGAVDFQVSCEMKLNKIMY